MLRTVSPSISPNHPDTDLLTLGERFDRAVIMMHAAEKRSNALCRQAHKLACDLAGIGYPAPEGQAHLFVDRLGEAETRIGGVATASDLAERLTNDVGALADDIAKHPPTTIEGARVHVRVFKEMYLGYGGNPSDDPNAEYNWKRVRALTDALLV